ncbi:MAG: hypothetical protein LBK42_14180 [Propionibacteriaceae bacterium]|nr:hypothetical protein [Propionibacteriaceae bacterium]
MIATLDALGSRLPDGSDRQGAQALAEGQRLLAQVEDETGSIAVRMGRYSSRIWLRMCDMLSMTRDTVGRDAPDH